MPASLSTRSLREFFSFLRFSILALAFSISGFAGTADPVTFTWDPNPEPDVVGYRLHFGTTRGHYPHTVEAGNTTRFTVTELEPGLVYYSIVTAYNTAGLESLPSNEVRFETAQADPLLTVQHESQGDGSVLIAPATMVLKATASNRDGKLVHIEFFANSVKIGTGARTPWDLNWNHVEPGHYTLSAVATYSDGSSRNSAPIAVKVTAPQGEDALATEPAKSELQPIPIQSISSSNGNDSLILLFNGQDGSEHIVQCSHDLIHWSHLGFLEVKGNYGVFIDRDVFRSTGQKYYRLVEDDGEIGRLEQGAEVGMIED